MTLRSAAAQLEHRTSRTDVAPLADDELVALTRGARDEPRRSAMRELADRYRPLVLSRAARLHRDRGASHDDVVSVAQVGLLKAVRDFDLDRGVPFAAYAEAKVVGEMMRWFRDSRYEARVPRPAHERAMNVATVVRTLEAELAAEPTADQIAERAGLTVDEVEEARQVRSAERGRREPLGAATAADTSRPDVESLIALRSALSRLQAADRRLLLDRFWEEIPQRVLGERLGVSQAHVSRLERRALDRLAALVRGEG